MVRPDRRSAEAAAYRRLYRTRRWLQERDRQLTEHPLCAMCLPRVTAATVCDHVDPRDKGDLETFFKGPFASLCKLHHDSSKQRQERRGHGIGSNEQGYPIDPDHPWNKGV